MKQREIKFRAWGGKQMHHFDLWWNHADYLNPEDVTVMQFTGLRDKNGVEIYELDLVKFEEYDRVYQVLYKEASFRLIHLSNDSLNGVEWGRLDRMFELIEPPTIEVIGNLFQNPNLL